MPYLSSISLHCVVVLITLLVGVASDVVRQCVKAGPCQCNAGVAWAIDLTPLDVGTPPRYSVPLPVESNSTLKSTIFFHPCESFRVGNDTSECGRNEGVAVCLTVFNSTSKDTNYIALGVQASSTFSTTGLFPNENVTIAYMSANGNKTTVNLKCNETDKNGTLTFMYSQTGLYALTLSSLYSCANAGPGDGLSVGSVLLILFFVVLMVYLIVGMVYKRFVMGASGFEIIPNYEFWIDFPFLVRDGLIFVCKGCKTEPSYDRI